ncbi:MAG: tetratricopeptide repeat protein [Ignavibacteriaceae bacterium]|nr:tetratricopeptide repeat protein [Ignavibacteriaceae bacterium]
MIWKVIIFLASAAASFFIPTPQELKDDFTGGQLLFASSNYIRAIEQYDKIINTSSNFLDEDSVKVTLFNGELTLGVVAAAYYQKANALKNLKMPDSAITIFRLVESKPYEAELRALSQFQIYDILYNLKRYDEAINDAYKLADSYPEHPKAQSALYDISWCFRELSHLDSSNYALLELLERYPETEYQSKALYQLGQNSFELKKYDDAISYWNVLNIRFKPDAFKDKDWENVQLKSVKERQIFEATSSRETDESDLELVAKSQVKIGDSYREKANYDSAMFNYRKVITNYSLLPVLVEATYIKMADYTRQHKSLEEGLDIYRKAIDDNFANKELQAKMQYKIADTYLKEKNYKRAAEEFEFYAKAYAEVANNINFTVEDALYTQATSLYSGEFYSQTIAVSDSFIYNYPQSEYIYDLEYISAVSSFVLKDYPETLRRFKIVADLKPDGEFYIPSLIYTARAEYELKNFRKSVEILTELDMLHSDTRFVDEINYYLIQAHYDLKNYDSIPSAFAKIRQVSPYFTPAIIKTTKSFILGKKIAEGEAFTKQLVEAANQMKDSVYFIPEAHFALADVMINKNSFDDAIKELTVVVDDSKTNELLKLQSIYLRGTLLGQVKKDKESIADLELVLNDPKFNERMKQFVPNARGRLATAYTKIGQTQKGINLMLDYIKNAADTLEKARYLVALTEVYYEMRDFKNTAKYGEQALDLNFDDDILYSRAGYLAGTSYNNLNNFDKAMAILTRSAARYPEINIDVFFNFAVNLYDNGYYKNAIPAFRKYVELYPESPNRKNSEFFIGYAFFKLGEWNDAYKEFKEFVKKFPEDNYAAEAQYNAAEALYNNGKFTEAIPEYELVYANFNKSDFAAAALYNVGWCNYQLKEIDKMIPPLQKLIKEFPKNTLVPEAQFTIGDYYYNKKEYTKALLEYKTFLDQFPDHYKSEEARSFIKELSQIDAFQEYQKAIAIFDKKNYKKAIEELSAIVAKYPDTEVSLACEANIASSYEQIGDRKKALELFKKIVEKHKDNPVAAGVVYFAQQHIEWIENETTASK